MARDEDRLSPEEQAFADAGVQLRLKMDRLPYAELSTEAERVRDEHVEALPIGHMLRDQFRKRTREFLVMAASEKGCELAEVLRRYSQLEEDGFSNTIVRAFAVMFLVKAANRWNDLNAALPALSALDSALDVDTVLTLPDREGLRAMLDKIVPGIWRLGLGAKN